MYNGPVREASQEEQRRESSEFGFPGQYDENGVDLALIPANPALSPTERARRADRARRAALRVMAIGKTSRNKPAFDEADHDSTFAPVAL